MPFVMRHVADPILDGTDRWHLLAQLEQRIFRITLAGCDRILKHDQWQVGGVGNAPEMHERHCGRLAKRERSRRKHKQSGGAALGGHASDARSLDTAIGPDTVYQRQASTDLV